MAPLHAARISAESVVWEDPYIDWSAYDLLLIRSTWDYAYRRDQFLAWVEQVAQQVPLFNPPHILRVNTHKGYLRELQQMGIPTVPTRYLPAGSCPELTTVVSSLRAANGIVVKPVVGNSGRWTVRVLPDPTSIAAAEQRITRILAHEEMMAQPFLPEIATHGETSIVAIEGNITHAVRKRPAEGEFRVQPEYGGAEVAMDVPAELAAAMNAALGVAGTTLYARADFVQGDGGAPLLMELELVEPDLFFRHSPDAVTRLVEAINRRV